jgi:hypothetical protein
MTKISKIIRKELISNVFQKTQAHPLPLLGVCWILKCFTNNKNGIKEKPLLHSLSGTKLTTTK